MLELGYVGWQAGTVSPTLHIGHKCFPVQTLVSSHSGQPLYKSAGLWVFLLDNPKSSSTIFSVYRVTVVRVVPASASVNCLRVHILECYLLGAPRARFQS